jgi:hypothetical protein
MRHWYLPCSLVSSGAIASVTRRRLIRALPGRPGCFIGRFDAGLLEDLCCLFRAGAAQQTPQRVEGGFAILQQFGDIT